MRRPYTVGVTALFVLASCSAGGAAKQTPSQAFCADLRRGLPVIGIWRGVKDKYPDPFEFAGSAWAMATISCPEQLKNNDGFRAALQAWHVDPDLVVAES